MLSDLTFIEDGNPNFTPDGLINWVKRALLYNILSQFLEFQRICQYDMPDIKARDGLLADLEHQQSSATQLYELSLSLEPRDSLPAELLNEKPSLMSSIKRLAERATAR